MSDSRRALDAHAYVDGGLSAPERAAFEVAMARDSRLRARVEIWRAQNEALQVAFGAPPRVKTATARASNENKPRRVATPSPSPLTGALALLGFALLALWPAGGPADPRAALVERAETALRTLAGAPLDFVSGDPNAVAIWLAARLPGLGEVSPRAPGWTLDGVRLVPGLGEAAALIVFEDALGQRAGLLVERTDAGREWPALIVRSADAIAVAGAARGVDFAAVGPHASGAAALALHPPR